MSPDTTLFSMPSRRTLARGIGWSVPVVALGAVAPAYASSLVAACPSCVAFGATSDSDNFSMTSTGTVSRVLSPILNLTLKWGTCSTSTYPNGITFSFASATVTLNDPIAAGTFAITYGLTGGTATTISSTSGDKTFSWSSVTLGNNPGVPVHKSTTANSGFTPVQICWNGTYSYTVGTTTFTKNITICNGFCSTSSQYTCSSTGNVSYQWSGTTCAAAPVSGTTVCS